MRFVGLPIRTFSRVLQMRYIEEWLNSSFECLTQVDGETIERASGHSIDCPKSTTTTTKEWTSERDEKHTPTIMINAAKYFKFPNKYLNWFSTNHYFAGVCLGACKVCTVLVFLHAHDYPVQCCCFFSARPNRCCLFSGILFYYLYISLFFLIHSH